MVITSSVAHNPFSSCAMRCKHPDRQIYINDRRTYIHTKQKDIYIEETDGQTDKHTEQTDIHTEQTDEQTDKHTEQTDNHDSIPFPLFCFCLGSSIFGNILNGKL